MHKPIKFLYALLIITLIGGGIAMGVIRETAKQLAVVDTIPVQSEVVEKTPLEDNPSDASAYFVSNPDLKDTLAVTGDAAVFATISDAGIEKLQATLDEESYNSLVDDEQYYFSESHTYLKKQKLKIIDTDKRYLSFVDARGVTKYVDTSLVSDSIFRLFLFKQGKTPLLVSMSDIETDYSAYFLSATDALIGKWKPAKDDISDEVVFEIKNGEHIYTEYKNKTVLETCQWYHNKDMISLDDCRQPDWEDSDGTTETIGDIKKLTTDELDVDYGGGYRFVYKRLK